MNAEELAETMQKLRDFTSTNGMQWVLDEVDDAVSLGVPETRTLRQVTRQGQTLYEDVTDFNSTGARPSRRHRRSEEFVSRRPLTDIEQIELLVQALRRVLIDLDDIATGSIDALNDREIHQRTAPVAFAEPEKLQDPAPQEVTGILFLPDEGSNAPTIDTESMRYSERHVVVSEILTRIENEIRS
jgi:hypothetical protein